MPIYNEREHLETDPLGVGPGARDRMLFQKKALNNAALQPIAFASKCLTNAETSVQQHQKRSLDILHILQKFHQHCFADEVTEITDHKLLVVIFKEDVAGLLQRLQRILLHILQYSVRVLNNPRPQLFIVD